MSDYWFKPKTYGYGASPSNWQGWAVTLGFAAVVVLSSLLIVVVPVSTGGVPAAGAVALWLVALLIALIWFWRLCRRKTDGEWRWRWGDKT